MLHSQMFRLVLDRKSDQNERQVLVLVSGDGNANENRTTFPEVVRRALQHHWQVEVWSWKSCLSRRFQEIEREYPRDMKICYLDEHKEEVTFVEKNKDQN